jgi:SpoIID/LytB domain protein
VASVIFVLFVVVPGLRVVGGQSDAGDDELVRVSGTRSVAIGSPAAGNRITSYPLELYVARVLAGEAEPNAPDGELEALAVAIRTYAIFNAGRHRRDGYDLCDTTHCQVLRAATAATRRAALATTGRILTYHGAPADVYYSASCGGRSEAASEVWPGTNLPYLVPVDDDVHGGDVPWTLDLTLGQIQKLLRGAGFEGRLQDIRVDARNASDRVARLRLRGLHPELITGVQFRNIVGPRTLRSTAFTLERRGTAMRFTGRGYGHGVGMCVVGAGRRARRGETAEQILSKYYPGLEVVSLDRAPKPVLDTAMPVTPPARVIPAGGVVARVPTASAITAAQIERTAMAARDTLSKTLGVDAAPMTIELHGSLDRFREVTGQPWWVSAVATGTSIDLAPAAVLEQRDGVDAAIREAVAELLVTPVLAGRPAWVRVGAARYFARTTPVAPPGKVRCPSDAELTLAISAAAQRDANARAEACFAQAYAHVKDWRAVR